MSRVELQSFDDPASLVGNAQAFPILREWRFFNHGGVCPLPAVAAEALRTYADQASQAAYIGGGWYGRIDALRHLFARMIGAQRGEIALVKNTSEGLGLIAAGIDWKPGDRIITAAVEYPSNVYPWMDLSRRCGVELMMVPERTRPDGTVAVDEAEIRAAMDHPRTRMVALSHVQFASGQRLDIARIGRVCRERGVLFCVDAIQTVGVLPVDVESMCIDLLSADGHKWLLGPEGAGFMYIRHAVLDQVRPVVLGWNSVINPQDYGTYDLTLKPDATRFECGTLTIPAFLALHASADLLHRVGTDFISARLKLLGDRLITGATAKGWQVVSPREATRWSGAVVMIKPGLDLKAEAARLRRDHKIELAVREGRLRATPHFYNTETEIDLLIEVLP